MEEIVGYIERITFQNPENGYTVAQLKVRGHQQLVCLVGHLTALRPGETVRCQGAWKNHLVHGRQFEVEHYQAEAPADLIGIRKYLGSGLIEGIGPIYAERIVACFGMETLTVLDQNPNKLLDVPGIGKKRLTSLISSWADQRSIREVMIFLQGHGVSPAFAQKIFKCYGPQSIDRVKTNPYGLARDIKGIGFRVADAIATNLGLPKDSPHRLEAGLEFVLSSVSDEGHVCYPQEELLAAAQKILEVDATLLAERLQSLEQDKRIVMESRNVEGQKLPLVWSKALYVCETGIAKELERLVRSPSPLRSVNASKAVAWAQEKLHLHLADNQHAAVVEALREKVMVITGGPGTGKSTITKIILAIYKELTPEIVLAAPTGRAAKRLAEITHFSASTIHSLLEFDFKTGGFKHNRQSPLPCHLIVIDEASMIDTMLMYHLLKALPDHCHVLFVGDVNQLPSVGPGNVLKDLIESDTLSVVHLTEIFRQARGSRIITNAHRINAGEFPDIVAHPNSDFFFLEEEDPSRLLELIVSLVIDRLPKKYGFDPLQDIQVLAPMKRGVVGCHHLNTVLQEKLNQRQEGLFYLGQHYRIGDKIMQLRNNYHKEVFNGDVGKIAEVDNAQQKAILDFDGRPIPYDFSELDEIQLAYAVSVHKYQGSECPCIVMPVHTSHFKLLHRNLLYTGVTRGKRLVVLAGSKKALAIAVHNDEVKRRFTGLKTTLTLHLP